MTDVQRYLTHRLVAQCTSVEGYAKVVQVISLKSQTHQSVEPLLAKENEE
ncbi:hypothetical protein C8E89_13441 [Mycolicibacterium moriokaense]|uniref:Uncharacterized protein n=1 Tax=Mycolicibacterium moriokaense TaxID=39691 RepID=A0A318H7B5_9MYCO|nr:hypothetical protein C8E89_13441 [Mycolicibacterium moriokaense]